MASSAGHVDLVRALLARGADPNLGDPLASAASKGYLEIARHLVDAGAKPSPRRGGDTPLHGAARNGHVEMCAYLLFEGADPNVRRSTSERSTPLDLAAEHGHAECVSLLSSCTSQDSPETPLRAIRAGRVDEVRVLLERGVDLDRVDTRGESPRMLARLRVSTAKLVGEPYTPHAPQKHNPDPTVFHAIYRGEQPTLDPGDLAVQNARGDSIVHATVIAGNLPVLERALAAGADPGATNNPGHTPWALSVAYQQSNDAFASLLLDAGARIDVEKQVLVYDHAMAFGDALAAGDIRRVDRLIDDGTCSLHVGQQGSPLLAAILNGDLEMARMLLEKGADPDVLGSGARALHIAAHRNDAAAIELLLEYGADREARVDGMIAADIALAYEATQCLAMLKPEGC